MKRIACVTFITPSATPALIGGGSYPQPGEVSLAPPVSADVSKRTAARRASHLTACLLKSYASWCGFFRDKMKRHIVDSKLHIDDSKLHIDDSKLHIDDSKLHINDSKLHINDSTLQIDDWKPQINDLSFKSTIPGLEWTILRFQA